MTPTTSACLWVTLAAARPHLDILAEAIGRALQEYRARSPTR